MKRILIVEDEAAIREFEAINLKRVGYETVEAGSGEEALDIFDSDSKGFDIALLDVMMPGMDGIEVMAVIFAKRLGITVGTFVMIYNLRGKLTACDINFIVVECGGVGFKCFTSLNTAKQLGEIGKEINVFTHLAVREDAMDLYAFATTAELDAFKLLITVSGIGPKAAVAILSELTPDRLALCIASGDAKSITAAQGVGKKTAERVVLELKDKIGSIATEAASATVSNLQKNIENSASAEAIEALVSLGYSQSDAAVVVGSLDSSMSVDEMIRYGLKELAKNL